LRLSVGKLQLLPHSSPNFSTHDATVNIRATSDVHQVALPAEEGLLRPAQYSADLADEVINYRRLK